VHFKRLVKANLKKLCLTRIRKKFEEANIVFVGCILSNLVDHLCDVFMHIKDGKGIWDALDASLVQLMLVVNCTSWRDFMILR
jgi:hypothetical protein